MSKTSIWPIDRTLSGATPPSQSEPESDSKEGFLQIPQNSSNQIVLCHMQDTRWESLTSLQRCSIFQSQPTGPDRNLSLVYLHKAS